MSTPGIEVKRPNLKLDGIITVQLTNGKHYTYRLRTIKDGSLAGQRVAELLSGPDNQHSYKAFGFVSEYGTIRIWTKCYTEAYIKHANLLMDKHPDVVSAWMQAGKCLKCGRVLTDPNSIILGIGPVCAGRQ